VSISVHRTSWRLTASAFVVSLALAGCGSTVQLSSGAQQQPVSGDGLSVAPVDAGLGQPPTPGGSATLGPLKPGSSPATVNGTTGPGGGSSTGSTGSTATRAAGNAAFNGRGVTSSTITIGAAIPSGVLAAGAAFGISGSGTVNEVDMWNTVVADVNKRGGVLGRKLVLYNHPVDVAAFVANPERTYGEVCADFKDDHKVFAAFVYVSDATLRQCFAKMGSPFVVYGASVSSVVPQKAFSEYGGNYLYIPGGITHERLANLMVESLLARSFTEKWDTINGAPGGVAPVKLGLIHADTPDQNNYYAAYTRELAARGWKFSATATYSGGVSDALAATKGAVLKFKAEGITHVFGASAFFLRDAEDQKYRPRYAFLPALGAFGAQNSPAAQMKGAMTVGWAPTADVFQPQDPGPTGGAARCTSVMKEAGLLRGNRQDLKLMYAVCDAVYGISAALTTGGEASVPGLRRGYEGLGSSFKTALTFAAELGPARHFGVNSVRDMAWDTACSCLKYTSRTNRS
jgi:hypothetical protein